MGKRVARRNSSVVKLWNVGLCGKYQSLGAGLAPSRCSHIKFCLVGLCFCVAEIRRDA